MTTTMARFIGEILRLELGAIISDSSGSRRIRPYDPPMTRRQIAGLAMVPVFCLVSATRDTAQSPAATHMECGQVAALKLPDVKVTESTAVAAATSGAVRVAHCRVNGVIGTEIRFSLLLPDAWNGKFMMGGGG